MRQGGVRGTWANEGAAPWSWTNLVNMTVESAQTTHTRTTAPGQYVWPWIFTSNHQPTYTLAEGGNTSLRIEPSKTKTEAKPV